MIEVTVKVPEGIKDIISDISETIYVEALIEVVRKRMSSTQRRLKGLKKKIAAYEAKHGRSYEDFSQNVSDTIKGHDDWVDWSYLVKVADEIASKIEKFKLLIGK